MYKIRVEYSKKRSGQVEAKMHVLEHDEGLTSQVIMINPTHEPCSHVVVTESKWLGSIRDQLNIILKYTKQFIALLREQEKDRTKKQDEVPEPFETVI